MAKHGGLSERTNMIVNFFLPFFAATLTNGSDRFIAGKRLLGRVAVRPSFPLSFAINFQASAVNDNINRTAMLVDIDRNVHLYRPLCKRSIVGNFDIHLHQLYQRLAKPFGLAIRQPKQLSQHQQRLDRRVAVDKRSPYLRLIVRVLPLLERLVRKPKRNITSV